MTESTYTYPVGRLSMKEPFGVFSARIGPTVRRRLVAHAVASGVKLNDVVQAALELYLSRGWKTKPVAREMVPRKATK